MAHFPNEDVWMALNICAARAGYSLRPLQEQVIISFVQGSDVFVGLPTGSGKSLCYNILPDVIKSLRKVKSSIAVIVSPLIALMKDQVRAMTEKFWLVYLAALLVVFPDSMISTCTSTYRGKWGGGGGGGGVDRLSTPSIFAYNTTLLIFWVLYSDYSTPSKGSCSSTMRGCCPHQ